MKDVVIMEHELSEPEYRTIPESLAHKMGSCGGFYKVKIIGDFGQVEVEYK